MYSADARASSSYQAHALFYAAPRKAELRLCDVRFVARGEQSVHVLVRTLWSGISRGTEKLIFEGQVPESEFERMRAPFQEGSFPFPVKFGYAAVGVVEEGCAGLRGKKVFALYPHQTLFALPREAVVPLPEAVPPRRAILAANMETALNAMWDAGACPGDKVVVVGAGAVGLLVASLASQLPGAEVTVCDVNPTRAPAALLIGAGFRSPEQLGEAEADVVFHTSATAAGFETSLIAAGFETRIVELSWYGTKAIAASLGAAFHSKRLRLISSQVGSVSDARRARWSHRRRLEKALDLLRDKRLDALITGEVDFELLPEEMPALMASNGGIATAVRYPT
jgi:2-desacetyl-2-hydroxyethyl bacteriochlorophyllide A dehydrogenase